MKKINKILGLGFLVTLTVLGCSKMDLPEPTAIDLGVKSVSTSIKSIIQEEKTVKVLLETTPGAKYSIQIIPFGKEIPVRKEGFTATDETTYKTYDLTGLTKNYYDFIIIDVNGKEAKYPLTIK
jgi:hypothetical protein